MKNLSLSRYKTVKGNVNIELLSNIDKAFYDDLFANENLFFDFLTISNLYKITELNLKEIFQSIIDLEKKLIGEKIFILIESDSEKLNINRFLLNYLFSFRTYVDHLETFINREFGKDSKEMNEWVILKSKIYKDNFAYRFIYKLRNYAQHCGMPIDIFEFSPTITNNNYSVKISIGFDPSNLLKKFDSWGNPLKSELQNSDIINLEDVIKDFGLLIKEFNSWFYEIIRPFVTDINTRIESILGKNNLKESNLCISFNNEEEAICIVDSVFRSISQIEKNYE